MAPGFFYPLEKKSIFVSPSIRLEHKMGSCEFCPLSKQVGLKHPKVEPCGSFGKEALVWCEAPGADEDAEGRPLVGDVGQFFRPYFTKHGLDLDRDCVAVNAVDCRPTDAKGENRKPTNREILCCWHRKLRVLEERRPRVIFLLGDSAITSYYGCDPRRKFFSGLPLSSYRGKVIPDATTGAWVCHSYHPSYIVRGNRDLEHVFDLDFQTFVGAVERGDRPPVPVPNAPSQLTGDEAELLFRSVLARRMPFAYDYESSSYRYYEGIHELYLVSLTFVGGHSFVVRLGENGELDALWGRILIDPEVPKAVQNLKHEVNAAWWTAGVETAGIEHDTMIASHLLDESMETSGLKKRAFIEFGQPDYGGEVEQYLRAEPKHKNRFGELLERDPKRAIDYSGGDSDYTYRLWQIQKGWLREEGLERAYRLFHEGQEAFARVERNGIRVNVEEGRRFDRVWGEEIDALKDRILSTDEAKQFEKVKGRPLKYEKKLSDADLRHLLFGILKFEPLARTDGGSDSVDAKTLKALAAKSELVQLELKLRRLFKLKNTYLSQFLRHEVGGFIYPSFNLHLTRSGRSSSSEPNFQNVPNPKRDPDWEEVVEVRRLIIPRDGHELWEVDYGSMEVRILACQSRDPVLIGYIEGGGDMHADEAENLFQVTAEQAGKDRWKTLRYYAKNQFVFPEFYGSYHKSIARSIAIPEDFFPNTTYRSRFEKWEAHIRRCEERFWEKYRKTREWQDRVVAEYKRTGYVSDGAWGFRRRGYLTRNKLYNFPIQGPAYHCLQWTINEAVLREMPGLVDTSSERGSKLCGEIHDALFFDGVPGEFENVRRKIDYLMTEKIREDNPWIIVPLATEWSRGGDWSAMKGVG